MPTMGAINALMEKLLETCLLQECVFGMFIHVPYLSHCLSIRELSGVLRGPIIVPES